MENHWWQVALYVTPRGLTTSAIPSGSRTFAVDFDFLDHHLYVRTSDGAISAIPLVAQSVPYFYTAYRAALRAQGIAAPIRPVPCQVETPIPLGGARGHAATTSYAPHACARRSTQTRAALTSM